MRPGASHLVQELGHVDDAHRQRLPVPLGGLPARRAVGMTTFGQQQGLGADLDRGVDQGARERFLQLQVAVVEADVGRVEAGLVHRPARTGAVQDLGRVGQRLGVLAQLGRRRGDQDVGAVEVARNRDAVLGRDLGQDVGQVFTRCRGAAPLPGGAVHQRQSFGHQAGLEHAVAGFLHELRDVDAHRAHRGAAAAQGAGVVDQLLPLLQLVDAGLLDQAERTNQRRERARLAKVGAPERLELVHRRVLGVTRWSGRNGRHRRTDRSARTTPCATRL